MSYGTVHVNPFTPGDTVIIPAGTPYLQNYYDSDPQTTKRATTITVDDVEPGKIRYYDTFAKVEEEQETVTNPFGHTVITTTVHRRSTRVHQPLIGKVFTGHNYRQYVVTAEVLEANNLTPEFTEPVDERH